MQAHPLEWPEAVKRTEPGQRKEGRFTVEGSRGWQEPITIAKAVDRVVNEIKKFTRSGHEWRCAPDTIVISSDLQLRNDGLPRSNQKKPDDPGVCLYYTLDDISQFIPMDSYNDVAQNIAACAAVLDAIRTLERHGFTPGKGSFNGFAQLPDPNNRDWRSILGYSGYSFDEAKAAYKAAIRNAHPDNGGSTERAAEVNTAWKQAKSELRK